MESENLIFIFFYSCTKFEGREMDMQLNLNLPSYKNSCSAFNENVSLIHGNSISFSLIFLILISLSNNPSNATTLHISHTVFFIVIIHSQNMAVSPPNQSPTRSQNPSLQTLLAADFYHSEYCLPTWDSIDNPYHGFNETRSHEHDLLETSFTTLSLSDPCCGSHFSANDNTSSIDSIPWRSSNELERENGLSPLYYTEEQQHLHTMRIQSAVRGHTGNWFHDLPSWQTNYRDLARQSSSSSSSSSTSLGQSFGAEMNYQYASSNPIIGNDLQWGSYEQKMFRSTIRPSSNQNGIRPEELKGPLICSLHKLMVHPYGENYVQKLFQQNNREITRYLHAMNCDEQMLFNICTHHQGYD